MLFPTMEGLSRAEVFPGECRPVPLLGNSRQRWGEPRQARARRALPGCPTQAVSSATTRRPDSAASLTRGRGWRGACALFPGLPRRGCWGLRALHQPGWSLGAPSCAGGWSGARGVRPPWSSSLRESELVEVVIMSLLGSAVWLLLRPALPGGSCCQRRLSPLKL